MILAWGSWSQGRLGTQKKGSEQLISDLARDGFSIPHRVSADALPISIPILGRILVFDPAEGPRDHRLSLAHQKHAERYGQGDFRSISARNRSPFLVWDSSLHLGHSVGLLNWGIGGG